MLLIQSSRAGAVPAPRVGFRAALTTTRAQAPLPLGLLIPLSPTAWLLRGIEHNKRYQLDNTPELGLLQRYLFPAVEHVPDWRRYFRGRFGVRSWQAWPRLGWNPTFCEANAPTPASGFVSHRPTLALTAPGATAPLPASLMQLLEGTPADLAPAPEPELLGVTASKPCPPWRRMRPVTLARYGGESDRFRLLQCDGSIAPEALDRLSVIARPQGIPRPPLPLPLEPDPASRATKEWVPGIKMLHPRLVWVVQRIAATFPRRTVYVISGYRREAATSYHDKGRALDLFVMGVPNEALFHFCHKKLHDVGCGYYPNNRFVHVDVRPYGSGHPMWIDISKPGTPSHYVNQWPGLVDSGAPASNR